MYKFIKKTNKPKAHNITVKKATVISVGGGVSSQ